MASLRKEECEMAAAAKFDAQAVTAWTAVERLLVKLHMV
jgi:hypothetical protein